MTDSRRSLRGRVAVVGVGSTRIGKLVGYDSYALGVWALKEALADSGFSIRDIDGLIVARIPDYQRFGEMLGMNPRYAAIVSGQGRMSGAAIEQAVMAIEAGLANTIALVYGNNGRTAGDQYGGDTDRYGSGGAGQWFPWGMTSPGAVHALMFQRHAHLYGTTMDQLGRIAVTFRDHAALNPAAVMRDRITLADYHASRYVCEPLHVFDYCLINDGGVALILTRADRAKDGRKKPVYIRGFSQASVFADSTMPAEDFWFAPMQKVATDAYAMAGSGPADFDALMIYDNFSPTVLFSLEGFGFCPVGESGRWVEGNRLGLNGEYPTNPSGGHLSESYMQGWALNAEAVRQIRGECGERQIAGCETAFYCCAAPLVTSIIYGSEAK